MRVKNIHGLLTIFSVGQAVSVGDDTVIIAGAVDAESEHPTHIVEYKKGNRMLKTIAAL